MIDYIVDGLLGLFVIKKIFGSIIFLLNLFAAFWAQIMHVHVPAGLQPY